MVRSLISILEKRGKPLCFGVHKDANPKVKQAFLRGYKGDTEEFEGYTLGWISEDDLVAGDNIDDAERSQSRSALHPVPSLGRPQIRPTSRIHEVVVAPDGAALCVSA
jgi:hypothetical protein